MCKMTVPDFNQSQDSDLIGDTVRAEPADLDDGLLHAARVDEVRGGRGGGGRAGLAA